MMIVILYLTETGRESAPLQYMMIVILYLTETRREDGHSTCDDCNVVSYRDP